jgi:hypothetical protein
MPNSCACVLRPEDTVEVSHQEWRDGGGEMRPEAVEEVGLVPVIYMKVEEGKGARFHELCPSRLDFPDSARNTGKGGTN